MSAGAQKVAASQAEYANILMGLAITTFFREHLIGIFLVAITSTWRTWSVPLTNKAASRSRRTPD
eukprot:5775594-Prorocentrum_lima.AAC.1